MKVIYKYPLKFIPVQTVDLTDRAHILSVQIQGETLTLWASIDTGDIKDVCTIYIIGTGQQMPKDLSLFYIATVQDKEFVWHIFKLNG